jgi:dihydrodipicolinate synthase/N-acetylneuraminate lyase
MNQTATPGAPGISPGFDLQGVWAAVPIPWSGDRVDAGLVRELLRRYAAAGVHGAYTAGTDGEMHVLEQSDFDVLVEALAAGSEETGLPVQAGCTWHHTPGVVQRIRYAAACGVRVAQLALPQWVPLNDDEILRFFAGLHTEVPDARFVHYNHAGTGRFLTGRHYRSLLEVCPTLVGTKQTGGDVSALIDVVRATPGLSHFVVDHQIVPGALFGSRGLYSFHANLVPRVVLGMWEACARGDWQSAVRHRLAMEDFLREWRSARPSIGSPALAKIATRAGVLSDMPLDVRAPYTPGTEDDVAMLRDLVRRHFPDGVLKDPGTAPVPPRQRGGPCSSDDSVSRAARCPSCDTRAGGTTCAHSPPTSTGGSWAATGSGPRRMRLPRGGWPSSSTPTTYGLAHPSHGPAQ